MLNMIVDSLKNLKDVAIDVREAYIGRQSDMDWVAKILGKYLSDASEDELRDFSREISSGIDDFNKKLISVQEADSKGISTAQWMRDMLAQHADILNLKQVEKALAEGNLNILETMQNTDGVYAVTEDSLSQVNEQLDAAGYDETARSEIISNIVRQAEATGAGTVVLGDVIYPANGNEAVSLDNEMLDADTGSKADKELKTMAAVVLKIGANSGKIPFLSSKTPMALITNIACVGVETARTAKKLFDGSISALEAMDRMAQVGCAAVADLLVKQVAPKALALLGPVGAAVGVYITPILATIDTEPLQKVLHAGYEMLKPVAVPIIEETVSLVKDTYNTVKTTTKKALSAIKDIF